MSLDAIDEIPLQQSVRGSHVEITNVSYQTTAHPSASWKLKAISVPLGSVQTINVSGCITQRSAKRVREVRLQEDGTLLLLISIVLRYFCLQEHAIGLIFRFDKYSMLVLRMAMFVSDRRKFSGRATNVVWVATS